ncbi:pyranose oxidase [Pilimelia terevasa]|uniref:Pyranose 2-oxidase n=1 Tax=Pilimelia terevasa TaxID=53372 RepID=A0A8J3BRH7_9ACTN|nr:pyranose oxidase [Pilimelia terevasa]GGK40217.1 pyranose oxidase [Pilimelia terevasa]
MADETIRVDTLIVGSGPVGSTFARELVGAGRKVMMIDAGAALSERPGEHLKNAYLYQKNLDLFSSVIRGHLNLLSVPPNLRPEVTLDPGAFQIDRDRYRGFTLNNQNPDQDAETNLGAAAVTYGVGGMATHWTCATPRHHPELERSPLLSDAEWRALYEDGERLLNTHVGVFEHSIRHQVVRDALQRAYPELPKPYEVQSLPLAVERRRDNPELVRWSGADTVLGELADPKAPARTDGRFDLRAEHLCTKLVRSADGSRIEYAEVRDLARWRTIRIEADQFVVAGNAYLTPQLLWASGIRPRALGRYLTEQPVAFCQIVLRQDLVDGIADDSRFAEQVRAYRDRNPQDPVPIPAGDPEPNVWIPVSADRPWHCQIHRDAFHYGDLAPNVDSRLIVDLRWFGIVEPRFENRISFSEEHTDTHGLPQPSFTFTLTPQDRARQHAMMNDMLHAATALGGFLPGSEPCFVEPGLGLHVHGTTRMGEDPDTSVVDTDSRVWGIDNLCLGGNNLIPRGTASNPTLTSVALALRAARRLAGRS